MISKSLYPLLDAILFSLLILFISEMFFQERNTLSLYQITYWVGSLLILVFWISLCVLNIYKFFGVEIQTSYKKLRHEIQKKIKLIIVLFIFFQILSIALFGTLGYFKTDLKYDCYLDILCITILFVASWEYLNYFKIFRLEILKKPPHIESQNILTCLKIFFFVLEASILFYRFVITIYFMVLTNQNVKEKTLNCYLKLLFILFGFKILGSSCQKYLKKLLLCASLFSLIIYDWYILTITIAENEEETLFFDFFVVVFIITHVYFILGFYILCKEWKRYRQNRRNPIRPPYVFSDSIQFQNPNKVGLTPEEIKHLKIGIYQNNNNYSEKKACTICTFDINLLDEIISFSCGHIFHSNCLVPWLQINKICPNCRQILLISEKEINVRNGEETIIR